MKIETKKHILKVVALVFVCVAVFFGMGIITLLTHAAEPLDPPELVAGASTIITEKLDAGAAISKSYNAKVARRDRIKALKTQADGTEISEDFTTATLTAISAAYDRAMSVDLSAMEANSETYQAVMAIRVQIQGFRDEAVSRRAKIAALMEGAGFANVSPDLKAVGASCIGIMDQVITAYEESARKEFIDYKAPR